MPRKQRFKDSPWLPQVDSHELAWAAGFFDGEGSTVRGGSTPLPRLQVGQKDTRLLDRFEAAVGPGGKREHRKDGFVYLRFYRTGNALSVLNALWPYMGPAKREQARKAILNLENG